MRTFISHTFITFILMSGAKLCSAAPDSLPRLKDNRSPQTIKEAWAGYDPRVEPIDAEVCKEWEEDGTVLRAVRYVIGTFKGRKAWMGAIY